MDWTDGIYLVGESQEHALGFVGGVRKISSESTVSAMGCVYSWRFGFSRGKEHLPLCVHEGAYIHPSIHPDDAPTQRVEGDKEKRVAI